MKNTLRKISWIFFGLLAAWAPGMDMSVQRKLRPDAVDLGGYLYQAIGRTMASVQTDAVTLAIVVVAVLWIARRYLYHKPQRTGIGEYLICGFFSLMQLLNMAINQTGTVAVLYANLFQILKTLLCVCGWFVLFLCALRALNELLSGETRLKCKIPGCWEKHPFLFPFVILGIAWLPHIIVKYPGVLTVDTVLQYWQYAGIVQSTTPHPPFGQLVYGWLIDQGLKNGCMNLYYFGYTLIKSIAFISILSYSLAVMRRLRVPNWICWLALLLYAVSPVYVGWATVISKDTVYLMMIILCYALMLDAVVNVERFAYSKRRMGLLMLACVLMILERHNGITIVIPLFVVLIIRLCKENVSSPKRIRFICFACITVLLGYGVEQAVMQVLHTQHVEQDDWLSIPFQQTARIVLKHGEEIPEEEQRIIGKILNYETIPSEYREMNSDNIRFAASDTYSQEELRDYLEVWWKQACRYPATALDGMLHMNGVLFDLQDNYPTYASLTNPELVVDIYKDSFPDMSYYNSEAIKPLHSWQTALTEWYFRFDDLPVIGQFASIGFCMELMICICYWSVVHRRKGMLCMLLPGLITGVTGIFCPIVYTRYLMPMMVGLPFWFAAWFLSASVPMAVKSKMKLKEEN